MTYITKKTETELKEDWKTKYGYYPTDLGHYFGIANHEIFYWQMENWAYCIDKTFEAGFPFNVIETALTAIVSFVYGALAFAYYEWAAHEGNKVMAKLEGAIEWAKDSINKAVEDMKNRIQEEIITPIQNEINNNILPQLKNAEFRINTISSDISGALSDLDAIKLNIDTFDNQIKAFDSKMSSFDAKIKSFTSSLSSLQSRINISETRLTNLNTNIQDVTRKANIAENKISSLTTSFEELKKRVSVLEGRKPEEEEEEEKPFFQLPKWLGG